jgi:hypothetical protein
MVSSFVNLIVFLVITIFYYFILKPTLTLFILDNNIEYAKFTRKTYSNLCVYFAGLVMVQFALNTYALRDRCSVSVTQILGLSALVTFIPWILIYGAMIGILIAYPAFKGAFADVIGYFYVSESANKLLSEILIDSDISKSIDKATIGDDLQKEAFQDAADAIIKICGNMSILINQIVPSNFNHYWEILKPLMKEKYANNEDKKQQLLDLVVSRDNVGEAMWFIYTGIFLISVIQYKIATTNCPATPGQMKANYQSFLDQEAKNQAAQQNAQSATYNITT